MNILWYYLMFCIATAVTATIVLYMPVAKELQAKAINHILISYKFTTYVSVLICGIIAAPLLFIVLIRRSTVEIFKSSLLKSFLS